MGIVVSEVTLGVFCIVQIARVTKAHINGYNTCYVVVYIRWVSGFHRIAWTHETGRLVVSPIFEDKKKAISLARHMELWNDRFTKLTIIEDDTNYAVCCYEDPLVSRGESVGVLRLNLLRIAGYDQARSLFLEKSPLFQILYTSDYSRLETYEQVSRLVSPARCRIIEHRDLKRQEFYYERLAMASL